MKIAAIDTGTNSTRLLISEYYKSCFNTLVREMEIVRIGRNLNITGNIDIDSAKAALKTLGKYKKLMEKHNIDACRAVGTNALRKARNSSWFIKYIYENTGINIEIITGGEEAFLSFYGASRSIGSSKRILVVDIGGGSTEFILGNKKLELKIVKSLDIGCVNISEKFIKGDRPGHKETEIMNSFIGSCIRDTIKLIGDANNVDVVGVGGTLTALASIDLGLEKYDSGKIHRHGLTGDRILDIFEMLCSKSIDSRKKVRGLEPGRADIILGGAAIILEIMRQLKKNFIIVSEKDILDGIIYTIAEF
jgi:exopolyphosphatase / guanosine-5'-triphosphate,3'-diphosphate pyrophosphatase